MYKVSSEIYKETNFQTTKTGCSAEDKVLSLFKFRYPEQEDKVIGSGTTVDKDGDLIVIRRGNGNDEATGIIEIEHSEATEIRLVGLQVWRGALLLADFIFYNRREFAEKQILELGAGVGLTSIAAAIFVRNVICTDIDLGGLLQLTRVNIERNRRICKCPIQVLEYDFLMCAQDYPPSLLQAIDDSDIFLAADVIYDDALTEAFVHVIDIIFERENISQRKKTIYIALEKRFVFTISELDAVAPMFEHFLRQTTYKPWKFEYISIDFPQYFDYARCAQLVLIKLTSNNHVEVTSSFKA